MKRRIFITLSLILVILCSVAFCFAATTTEKECADALYELGLFSGTGKNADGTPIYGLDKAPTRAEAITMLIGLLGKSEEATSQEWDTPFTDVPDWAKPYVGYAYNNGLTSGISATKFGSNDLATETQYLTFVLKALGYSASEDFKWDEAKKLTDKIGITSDEYGNSTEFDRGNVVSISYMALKTEKKGSKNTLLKTLYDAGSVISDEITDVKIYSYTDNAEERPISIQTFISDVNANHKAATEFVHSKDEFAGYINDFFETLDLVSEDEAKSLTVQRTPKKSISRADAEKEVDLLFRTFKCYYGAYDYFGGDDAFNAAKENIINELSKYNSLSVSKYKTIIVDALSFIQDGHLQVSGTCVANFSYDYYVDDYYFYEDTNGYYTKISGLKWYLTSVDTYEDVKKFLRVSIDDEGSLCFIISYSGFDDSVYKNINTFHLQRGTEVRNIKFKWVKFGARDIRSDLKGSFTQDVVSASGVTNIKFRDGKKSYEDIVSSLTSIGQKIQKIHLTFFDVWTSYDYDELIAPRGYKKYSEIQNFKASNVAKYIGRTNIMPNDITFGTYYTRVHKGVWVESDDYMFVLQDKNNGSGLESYLHAFKTVENTVFIGTASNGLQICGGNYTFFLPYSGCAIQFGMNMMYSENTTSNIDGIGYEPDIWIEPSEAKDAVARMCKYYGL